MTISRTDIQNMLEHNVMVVDFIKVNGDKRTMTCTLRSDIIPTPAATENEANRNRAFNEHVQVVWDTSASGWRSFRYDSVSEAYIVEEYNREWYNKG
jgi:hypothetical protein